MRPREADGHGLGRPGQHPSQDRRETKKQGTAHASRETERPGGRSPTLAGHGDRPSPLSLPLDRALRLSQEQPNARS